MNEKNKFELFPDSRFRAIGKEARIVVIYWLTMFTGIIASAYFFGSGDPTQYIFLFGFPLWFTISICIMMIGIVVGIFMLLKVFKDVTLDAADPEFDYGKGVKNNEFRC